MFSVCVCVRERGCVFYTCGCIPIEMLIANQLLRQVAREQAKTGRDEKKRYIGNRD